MNIFDFSNNLLNWLLLVILLGYLWARVTPALFDARAERIESSLEEAEKARKEAEKFLSEQQARIADAESEADKILSEAKGVASTMADEIRKQTAAEEASLRHRIKQQIDAEKQMAITEMRGRTATVAVMLAGASLPDAITDSARGRLHQEFVAELENGGIKS